MKNKITIKKTIKEDNNLYFILRNNKKFRKHFFNNKSINKLKHSEWFNKNFKSKYFYTCFYKSEKIGYLRGDENNGVINISIAIKNKYQKKGLASEFYKIYEKKLKSNSILIAQVHKNNNSSINFFLKNDYEILKKQKSFIIFYKIHNIKLKKYLKVIDNIENIRKSNNINWMNILRIAFKNSPSAASLMFKNIFSDDQKISSLSKKLF